MPIFDMALNRFECYAITLFKLVDNCKAPAWWQQGNRIWIDNVYGVDKQAAERLRAAQWMDWTVEA
jgi:hypothetical protein